MDYIGLNGLTAKTYFGELERAMIMLADDPKVIFMGQAVGYPGTAMHRTLEHIASERRLEMPVAEDMQLGMAIGMSLNGYIPVCCYPRWNFLLLATNQLVLHLDKLPKYSDYLPKIIIRVAVAIDQPLNPGPQHLGDFSQPFRDMLKCVHVFDLKDTNQIMPLYGSALHSHDSTLLVEHTGLY